MGVEGRDFLDDFRHEAPAKDLAAERLAEEGEEAVPPQYPEYFPFVVYHRDGGDIEFVL